MKKLAAGFETRSSGFGSICSANCAAHHCHTLNKFIFSLKWVIPGLSLFIFGLCSQVIDSARFELESSEKKARTLDHHHFGPDKLIFCLSLTLVTDSFLSILLV